MRIVCAGGGTLGSVTPLLAVLQELAALEEVQVDWFGTRRGPERSFIVAAGYNFHALPEGKWRRYFSWRNLTDPCLILISFVRALGWFMRHKADVVLTAGSFVAVPVGWAAWLCGVPVFVHQQDVRVGLANKLLRPIARRITVALKSSLNDFPNGRAVFTGNPVRRDFTHSLDAVAARRQLNLDSDLPTIVVLGGGTGAQFLNELITKVLPQLSVIAQIFHLTGSGRGSVISASARYHPQSLALDMLTILAAADVVLTRAGMGTLTELAALRRAAIVVPIPGIHQEDNGKLLSDNSAALVMEQAVLTPEVLLATVGRLLNDSIARQRLGEALGLLLPPGAAVRVAQEIRAVVKH